jgi:hypothetical protein
MLPADDRRDCRRRCRGNDRGGAIAARPGQAGRRPAGDPDGHAVARAGCWCREGITTTHSRGAARPNGWTGLASRDAARIDWHAGWDLCLFSRAAAGWQQVIPPVCLLAGPCAGSATASPAAPAPSWLAPGQVPRADRTRSRTRPQPATAPAPARRPLAGDATTTTRQGPRPRRPAGTTRAGAQWSGSRRPQRALRRRWGSPGRSTHHRDRRSTRSRSRRAGPADPARGLFEPFLGQGRLVRLGEVAGPAGRRVV